MYQELGRALRLCAFAQRGVIRQEPPLEQVGLTLRPSSPQPVQGPASNVREVGFFSQILFSCYSSLTGLSPSPTFVRPFLPSAELGCCADRPGWRMEGPAMGSVLHPLPELVVNFSGAHLEHLLPCPLCLSWRGTGSILGRGLGRGGLDLGHVPLGSSGPNAGNAKGIVSRAWLRSDLCFSGPQQRWKLLDPPPHFPSQKRSCN